MAGSESRPKALAVDDDPTVVKLLLNLLTRAGFEAVGAGNALEARVVLASDPIAILITDLQMPGGGGLDLVKHLRENGNPVPAILLSGTIDEEVREQAARLSRVACMEKPPNLSHLLGVIEQLRSNPGR
jgi:DNA-binding NtrC family response regulator